MLTTPSRSFDEYLAAIPQEVTFDVNGRQVTRTIPEEDRVAQARLDRIEDEDPVCRARKLDRLVTDLIDLQAEGDATRKRLLERGWKPAYLDEHLAAAGAAANQRFVRNLDTPPRRSLPAMQNDMADIIGSLLPSTQVIVAELQARGFSAAHIDLLLQKARAKAALAFCHGQTGWAN